MGVNDVIVNTVPNSGLRGSYTSNPLIGIEVDVVVPKVVVAPIIGIMENDRLGCTYTDAIISKSHIIERVTNEENLLHQILKVGTWHFAV